MYSKKARVESMTYLSKYDNVMAVLLENTNKNYVKMCPRYYLGQWIREYEVTNENPIENLEKLSSISTERQPRFFLFFEEDNLEERVENVKVFFPNITYEKTIKPGFIDKVLHLMNPLNANQTIYIYKNKDFN